MLVSLFMNVKLNLFAANGYYLRMSKIVEVLNSEYSGCTTKWSPSIVVIMSPLQDPWVRITEKVACSIHAAII